MVIFNLTVEEEVSFGVYNLKLDHPKERIKKALESVGLEGFEKRDPQSLSGGQKQLLCIACVLAMGTDYIILDENRLKYVGDHIDNEKYDILLKEIPKTHTIVFQDDGIYLFKKKVLFPLIPSLDDPEQKRF